MSKEKKFAAFDIDGTLVRWQLYHAIVDELAKLGHLSGKDFELIRTARKDWKTRAPNASFKSYENELVNVYRANLAAIDPAMIDKATEQVFEEYKDQVYTYTRDLIKRLKDEGYLIFAISGSHTEIVAKVADHYGFDDFRGTIFEKKDGKFTGNVMAGYHNKDLALKDLVKKHQASFSGSYAVGDSLSDSKMMQFVDNPIAFNPDSDLLKIAKDNGWKVVIERKNVIYELEKGNAGTYVLV